MINPYHYPGEELQMFEKAKKWKRYLATKLNAYIRGDVLEVGAGIGEMTSYLVNKNVTHWMCLEPDQNLYEIIEQKVQDGELPGLCNASHGNLCDLPVSAQFDTIIYIDVLEHIEDDKAEFERSISYLRKGGNIIVLAPAHKILFGPFDKAIGHFRRYTKKTLREACNSSDLVELKMFYLESTGYFLLFFNKFIFRKKYPSERDIWIWQNVFVPVSKLLDKILFYKLGKSIIGIWQKR